MFEKDKIRTVEQARDLTLLKWGEVRTMTAQLFSDIDARCGFCFLSKNVNNSLCDDKCPVSKRCKLVNATASNIEDMLLSLIDETLVYLRELKV